VGDRRRFRAARKDEATGGAFDPVVRDRRPVHSPTRAVAERIVLIGQRAPVPVGGREPVPPTARDVRAEAAVPLPGKGSPNGAMRTDDYCSQKLVFLGSLSFTPLANVPVSTPRLIWP
jgi:hypothetical protein